ncbi:hypothetical protein BD410DRAFT_639977 [Rickenella mellea]|uniref:Uncharacterized protein n=1 Tax=Rickenella mellea TaxID=50990 RepID=A0A4Y7QF16_9AGAM|nr:hypothetical protein BD410DRAFT_639977 [Rickenella mellea]
MGPPGGEIMSDASLTSQAPTPTITECWVFSTSGDYVFSTPAYPVASGAECFVIFPTGGGTEKSPIPNSAVHAFNTDPANSSPITPNLHAEIIGAVVGSILGVLIISSLAAWIVLTRRKQRREALLSKRRWAFRAGKWIVDELKAERTKTQNETGAAKPNDGMNV